MKVRYRRPELFAVPEHERAFVSPSQTFLSVGRDYPVYAVSVYDSVTFVQVVDDKDTPVFLPRALFDVTDPAVPGDWICNVFADGPVQMVLGPPYVAKDLESYQAMIDLRASATEPLWTRIDAERARDR